MSDKSRKYYKDVAENYVDTDEVVIPDNETWEIQFWIGSANPTQDTHVKIVWDFDGDDEEIIALTHTSAKHIVGANLIGDGVKKLAICLVNDSGDTESLGVEFTARSVE